MPGVSKNGTASTNARVEAEVGGEPRLLLESSRVARRRRRERRVLVAGHPRPLAVDLFVADDAIDLLDGGEAGVPHRLGVIAAEVLHQLGQIRVGHAGDVRRRQARVDAAAAPRDRSPRRAAGALQQVGGGQPGDAGADDDDVDGEVAVERADSATSTTSRSQYDVRFEL